MSGRVNDFLTCRYMVPARPGDFRPAQKPLSEPLGRSNRRPGQPGTAPESPRATQGAQEGSKGRPEPPPEAARSPQEGPQRPRNHAKTMLKPWFLQGFVKTRFRRPRAAQDAPKEAQEAARTAPDRPGRPKMGPNRGPKKAQGRPSIRHKRTQEQRSQGKKIQVETRQQKTRPEARRDSKLTKGLSDPRRPCPLHPSPTPSSLGALRGAAFF